MGRQRPLLAVLMAATAAAALYRAEIKPWMYTWGASADEVDARLPGDELVAADGPRTTRALTIDAPVEQVWPWLAQIGEDRAGFYSYAWLERAVGADIHNANVIQPQWQHLTVGDTVWLARRYGSAARQVVAAVKPQSHLLLMSPADYDRVQHGQKASGLWGFHLLRDGRGTRLLVRGSGRPVGNPAFDIPHFVMEQKMMRGIRDRAQAGGREQVVELRNPPKRERLGI
ncbi:hypothetical protein DVS77_12720 [Mycolicibacterium moriokaense]|nr:hypothetical protein DVS77_12720 [Mycolicibacterium moriokaense]